MRLLLLFSLFAAFTVQASAQEFSEAARRFSEKKVAYITLADGTEHEGYLKDLDRKKGLIKSIKMEIDGDKRKFKPADVREMYLMPTLLNQAIQAAESVRKFTTYKDGLDESKFLDGYVLLQSVDLTFKRGKAPRTLLVQLINPASSSGIRVYEDPMAKRTMSAGVGPMSVGGNAKSYYFQKGDEPALRLKRKNYKEEFDFYFGSCAAVMARKDAGNWGKVHEHVAAYAECE